MTAPLYAAVTVRQSLDDLAERVRAEHEAATGALRRSLGHMVAAGLLLIEAKKQMRHGEWLPWLARTTAPERTARRYMYFAKNKAALLDQNGHVADLAVQAATDLIAVLLPGKVRQRPRDGYMPDISIPYDIAKLSVREALQQVAESGASDDIAELGVFEFLYLLAAIRLGGIPRIPSEWFLHGINAETALGSLPPCRKVSLKQQARRALDAAA